MSFGFLKDKAELAKKFDDAIDSMKSDGTLAILEKTYVEEFSRNGLTAAKFGKFEDAETLTVAVTGDLPPIDYVDSDGTPAGFNAAVLSEVARRLHVNINIMNIETGARIAALSSQPYYTWNEQYFIGSK